MTASIKSPSLLRFYRQAIGQQVRYINREISKDQLMENLRALAERQAVFSWVDWTPWTEYGYVLPWERQDEKSEAGTPGQLVMEGGAR